MQATIKGHSKMCNNKGTINCKVKRKRSWIQFPGNTHTDKTFIAFKSLWIKASAKCFFLMLFISRFEKLTLPTLNNNYSSLSSLTFHHLSLCLSILHNLALSFSPTSNFALASVKVSNSLWFSESLETEPHVQLSRHTHRVRFCSHSFFTPISPLKFGFELHSQRKPFPLFFSKLSISQLESVS